MKKFLKKVSIFMFVVCIFTTVLTGCGGTDKDTTPTNDASKTEAKTEDTAKKEEEKVEQVTVKIAHMYAADHPVNVSLQEKFVKMVDEKTNGKFKIELYPSNQLGDVQEQTEGVQLGTIEMTLVGNLWENTIPAFRINQMPYMFDNYEHAYEVLNGPIGQKIYDYLKEFDVNILASFPNGFRVISNSKRAINSVEDCKGIKLRVFEGKTIIDQMNGLGFDTVVMAFGEVFTALQQKVIDGQDNPLATAYYAGFYDVQDYIAITNHMYSPGYVAVNMGFWDSLSAEEQKIFNEASKATVDEILRLTKEQDEEIIKAVEEKGVQVTYPEAKEFRAAAQPIIDEYLKENPDMKEIIDEIRAAGE
jgi:tripartite ATP-independent transporter DctP family solute receptor